MTRDQSARTAADTVEILERGHYMVPSGKIVSIAGPLAASVAATRLIQPEDWPAILERSNPRGTGTPPVCVTAETTLQAAHRLVVVERQTRVLALNFASARNPGGGFLNGARAQEESIARSSGLYPTLLKCPPYYTANRAYRGTLYTDHAILSPNVPVIRDDAGTLLDEPYEVTILTMPAPNRGAMPADSAEIPQIAATFQRRIAQIFALAAAEKYPTLILGAWGCGAFRNDPTAVAQLFADAIAHGHAAGLRQTCFAVFDPTKDTHIRWAFESRLTKTPQLAV